MGWGPLVLAGPGHCGRLLLPFLSELGHAELQPRDDTALEVSSPLHFQGSAVISLAARAGWGTVLCSCSLQGRQAPRGL